MDNGTKKRERRREFLLYFTSLYDEIYNCPTAI